MKRFDSEPEDMRWIGGNVRSVDVEGTDLDEDDDREVYVPKAQKKRGRKPYNQTRASAPSGL